MENRPRKLNISPEVRARLDAQLAAIRAREEARQREEDEAAERERRAAIEEAVELLRENGYTVTPPAPSQEK